MGETVSAREAARRIGVSGRSVQRRRDLLLSLGAKETASGWEIPVNKIDELRASFDATPPASRPATDARHIPATSPATHDACRTREHELSVELATMTALAQERSEEIKHLREQNAALIEQSSEAVTAASALALTLRQTTQQVEASPVERHTPEEPHPPADQGLRRWLKRFPR